ncbi:sensor histidine kinase [Rhodococcus sp. 27YEA15]|uniref:sensor histidine kinase n=1 Tax=Rhodococcus sp. 27YEA15 TaxID=3156259 RepID=UPI003C7A7F30
MRNRLTFLAALLVAVTLAVAAGVTLLVVHKLLHHSADVATTARARQIAAVVESDGVGALDGSLLTAGRYVDVIHVLDSGGRVVFGSAGGPGSALGPVLRPGEQLREGGLAAEPGGSEFRAARIGVDSPDSGPMTIEVGAAEGPLYSVLVHVGALCAALIPIIGAAAALTYYFVGRVLEPVEEIRRQVDDISGGDLDRRVPVPATGDEIATLAATMNGMLDRIDAARAQQMRFVGDASHELNSPLTTLVGLLDLSRETRQPIDVETVETVMLPEALRLKGMVSDLLFLARADENGVPLRGADLDLDELVSAEVARLEALGRHEITATVVPARVRGDEEKLARALRNIADNATRHTVDRLAFDMSVDGDQVRVTVADNGPGIADPDKTRVTGRFVRLDDARERSSGGSGLGLAIVDEIVRAHDGHIVITDTPGGGATVGFTVPVQSWDR